MGKVVILGYTNILSLKIKDILTQIGFSDIEVLKTYSVSHRNGNSIFRDVDLILADLDNSSIDVVELITTLKSRKEIADIPIISLSQSSDVAKIKKIISFGCYDFILKPFDAETLIRKIFKVAPKCMLTDAPQTIAVNNELLGEGSISLNWTRDFEIGIKEIDEEHRKIIEQFGMLYSSMIEGHGHEYYQELLDFLYSYVNTHFEHEESLQREIGYDKCKEHKIIHDKFKLKVNEMIESKKGQSVTNMDLIHINLFIKDWLINHILITDKKIKMFLH